MTLEAEVLAAPNRVVEIFEFIHIDLDYSLDSIKKLEEFFVSESANGQPKAGGFLETNTAQIVFLIGCYLGEVIKRNVKNGRWNIKEDSNIANSIIAISNEHSATEPIQKVAKRLQNGPEDNLFHYAQVVISEMNKAQA